MYKGVIFDVDGTILDSSDGIIDAIKHTIKQFALANLTDEALHEFVGFSPLQGAFSHFCCLDSDTAQNCAVFFREYYKKDAMFKSTPYEKIFSLLDFLKLKGVRLGVATYKRQDYATELMRHFGFDRYFDIICGADNENKLKKIDIVQNCLNQLGVTKDDAVLIGDSIHDAGAAKRLGMDFIGVTYGFGFKNKSDMDEFSPTLRADSVEDIINYFHKNLLS